MWMLALSGIFLAAAQACVFCRFPDRDLSGRLAQLCSQMEAQWKDCEVSWNFSAFALGMIRYSGMSPASHSSAPSGAACGFPAVLLNHLLSPQPFLDTLASPPGKTSDPGKVRKGPEPPSGLMRESRVLTHPYR